MHPATATVYGCTFESFRSMCSITIKNLLIELRFADNRVRELAGSSQSPQNLQPSALLRRQYSRFD